jgi:L-threonylcarbamoyladenylate synthase
MAHISHSITNAVTALKNGGIIAYPTEAIYGLGCDPLDSNAVKQLLKIKQRKKEKGLILIAASMEQLTPYLQDMNEETRQRVLSGWPGPITWILPAKPEVPELLRGNHNTIAVRVTNHPIVKQLCKQWGSALVSTSANLSGQTPALSATQVEQTFNDNIDFILEGEIGDQQQPTQIRDGQTGKIIRH